MVCGTGSTASQLSDISGSVSTPEGRAMDGRRDDARVRHRLAGVRRRCTTRGVRSLPASGPTVAAYVDELITRRRLATVRRRVAAVRARHVDAGHRSPTSVPSVRAALAGAPSGAGATTGGGPRRSASRSCAPSPRRHRRRSPAGAIGRSCSSATAPGSHRASSWPWVRRRPCRTWRPPRRGTRRAGDRPAGLRTRACAGAPGRSGARTAGRHRGAAFLRDSTGTGASPTTG